MVSGARAESSMASGAGAVVRVRRDASLPRGMPISAAVDSQPSGPLSSQAANSSACRSAFAWLTHCHSSREKLVPTWRRWCPIACATYQRNQGRGSPARTPMMPSTITSLTRPRNGKVITSRPNSDTIRCRSTGILSPCRCHNSVAFAPACTLEPLEANMCSTVCGRTDLLSRWRSGRAGPFGCHPVRSQRLASPGNRPDAGGWAGEEVTSPPQIR